MLLLDVVMQIDVREGLPVVDYCRTVDSYNMEIAVVVAWWMIQIHW